MIVKNEVFICSDGDLVGEVLILLPTNFGVLMIGVEGIGPEGIGSPSIENITGLFQRADIETSSPIDPLEVWKDIPPERQLEIFSSVTPQLVEVFEAAWPDLQAGFDAIPFL